MENYVEHICIYKRILLIIIEGGLSPQRAAKKKLRASYESVIESSRKSHSSRAERLHINKPLSLELIKKSLDTRHEAKTRQLITKILIKQKQTYKYKAGVIVCAEY